MSIHREGEGAIGLVTTNKGIVRDDSAWETEEGAVPVHNEVVAATSAEDVATPTEPSDLTGTIHVCKEIAVGIAASAGNVEKIVISSGIKGATITTKHVVVAACCGICTSVTLLEVAEGNVGHVNFTLIEFLLANHIKTWTKLAR